MAAVIQIPRGVLERYKYGEGHLPQGSLFWQPRNLFEKDDSGHNPDGLPYEEGALFIGDPTCDGEDNAIEIGGWRNKFTLMFRGTVEDFGTEDNPVEDISHGMFKHAHIGDFWRFNETPISGEFHTKDDFRKKDLILITAVEDVTTEVEGHIEKTGIRRVTGYIRIAAGLFAEDLYFNKENSDFKADHVDEALRELETEKISFRGDIGSSADLSTLETSDNLHIGTMYLVTADDIVFNSGLENLQWTSKRGDFAVYTANITDDSALNVESYNPKNKANCFWHRIKTGNTDAADIDYLQYGSQRNEMTEALTNVGTFLNSHITTAATSNTVKKALDFLFLNKAQLDSHGKVPLSQLHDTVLGSLQYKGVWSPIKEDAEVSNDGSVDYLHQIENQNPWPTGHGDEYYDGVDGSPSTRPSNGDYYVVQIPKKFGGDNTYLNVHYIDRDSYNVDTGLYTRTIELNTGDWIVFQASNDEADEHGNDGHNGRWEKIDNTDRLASIGFHINGQIEQGANTYTEAVSIQENKIDLLGSPSLKASHKICLYEDNLDNTVTIAGLRLVDQRWNENDEFRSRHSYLPKYYGDTNALENSHVKEDLIDNVNYTTFESNLRIGEENNSFQGISYGDFNLRRYITPGEMDNFTNAYLNFEFQTRASVEDGNDQLKLTLKPSDNLQTALHTEITLPEKTSTVIGKLEGINLVSNYITKTDINGYIKDSSVYEHCDPDGNPIAVEFTSERVAANDIVVRRLTFGRSDRVGIDDEFIEGNLPDDEPTTHLITNVVAHNITVTLPAESATLFSLKNYRDLVKGSENRLAIYGAPKQLPGTDTEKLNTFEESYIRQTSSILLENLKNRKTTAVTNMSVDTPQVVVEDENNILDAFYGKTEDDTVNEDVIIETDVIIGEILNDLTDNKNSVFGKTRSLKVSKSVVVGNNDTANFHILPGRPEMFKDAVQYRNVWTETLTHNGDLLPETDVFVAPPAESGVLITSNSRLDGGFWR